MIRHDKADGNYVDIPAVYTTSAGVLAEPDTSFKLYLYPANSETATLDGVDLDEIGTSGIYSYTWDVSAVAVGNYHGSIIAVNDSSSYPVAVSVEITDTNTRLTTIDTNVDSVLEDTGTTLPAAIATAGQGNGNKEVKFLVRDVANVSAGGGCAVTIYANTGTTTQSTGTLYTDELGIINVMLNAGTYYARAVKSGKTFPNPITITVNA